METIAGLLVQANGSTAPAPPPALIWQPPVADYVPPPAPGRERGPDCRPDSVEECARGDACDGQGRRCAYYWHYLGRGPAALPHAAYHAQEALCRDLQQRELTWETGHPRGPAAPFATLVRELERRVRA